jgi:hypothetical protein
MLVIRRHCCFRGEAVCGGKGDEMSGRLKGWRCGYMMFEEGEGIRIVRLDGYL